MPRVPLEVARIGLPELEKSWGPSSDEDLGRAEEANGCPDDGRPLDLMRLLDVALFEGDDREPDLLSGILVEAIPVGPSL